MRPAPTRLVPIILAAGWGRRMGRPKALLPVPGGGTLLDAAFAAVGGHGTLAVVGPWLFPAGRRFSPACSCGGAEAPPYTAPPYTAPPYTAPPCTIIVNPDPDRGPISSLRCAIEALPSDWTGLLVLPVDHARVQGETVKALADAHAATPDAILIPVAPGPDRRRRGHPVVFPRWTLADLLGPAAAADGARAVVRAHASLVREVPVDDPMIFMDLNEQQGYLSLGWDVAPT